MKKPSNFIMFRFQIHALCAAPAAAVTLTASAAAQADTHYYALLESSPSLDGDDGAFIEIWTNDLHSTCNILTKNFVNHELWYGVYSDDSNWVEVGFKDGVDVGGGCQTHILFWADQRHGGGYHEHYPGNSWSLGTWIPLQVSRTSVNCSWAVGFNGTQIGTSTNNCPIDSGRLLTAGIESTSQTTGNARGWLRAC